jgi:hypothetical protein
MAKYKVLKSVAHNTGHSLLGATNWYAGDFPFRHLSRAMREAEVPRVELDLLKADIRPAQVRNPVVNEFAELGRIVLRNLLTGEGWTLEQMRRATFYLDLDAHECRVELEDDRGKLHVGNVVDWGFNVAAS